MTIPPLEPSGESGPNLAPWSAPARLDDEAVGVIGETVRHAAGALDGLKDILEGLQSSVALATEQRRTDMEIGHLFMRAQAFLDEAVAEGHELAQRIVADAEFEASRIVAAAKHEAHRLIDEGRHSASLPSEAVRALQSTIEEFGRMNSALVQELSGLTDALAFYSNGGPGVSTHSQELSHAELGAVQPQSVGAGNQHPQDQQTQRSAAETVPSPPTGYWSTLRPRRQPSSARVG